jgi:hypothetical protein
MSSPNKFLPFSVFVHVCPGIIITVCLPDGIDLFSNKFVFKHAGRASVIKNNGICIFLNINLINMGTFKLVILYDLELC